MKQIHRFFLKMFYVKISFKKKKRHVEPRLSTSRFRLRTRTSSTTGISSHAHVDRIVKEAI